MVKGLGCVFFCLVGCFSNFFFFIFTVNTMACPIRVVSVGYSYILAGLILLNAR